MGITSMDTRTSYTSQMSSRSFVVRESVAITLKMDPYSELLIRLRPCSIQATHTSFLSNYPTNQFIYSIWNRLLCLNLDRVWEVIGEITQNRSETSLCSFFKIEWKFGAFLKERKYSKSMESSRVSNATKIILWRIRASHSIS